jgi:putative ABC transport system permease protein
MLRSLANLQRVRPGFDAEQVLTVGVDLPEPFGGRSVADFYEQTRERLAALPGVTGTAITDCLPLDRLCNTVPVRLHDRPAPRPGAEPFVGAHWASPGLFRVLGVPLRYGRLFTPADRAGAPKVVLVSEAAARAFWPGRNPVGRPVSVGVGPFWQDTATVVGVVGDVRFGALDSLPRPELYVPYAQAPRPFMILVLRTAGDPLALAAAARQAVRAVSPDAPVHDVRPLRDRVADATAYARFRTLLLTLFGGAAVKASTP